VFTIGGHFIKKLGLKPILIFCPFPGNFFLIDSWKKKKGYFLKGFKVLTYS